VVIILNSERHFIYLKWCAILDCYKQKVFTKRPNKKLFTRRYIIFKSQFQPQHSPVKHNFVEGFVEPVDLM